MGASKAEKNTQLAKSYTADLILHHGKIATMDADESIAQAVAVKAGRILMAGTDERVLGLKSPNTELIDLSGRMVIPGIIDSHCHPDQHALYAYRWHHVGWPAVRSISDCLDFIRKKTQEMMPDTETGALVITTSVADTLITIEPAG